MLDHECLSCAPSLSAAHVAGATCGDDGEYEVLIVLSNGVSAKTHSPISVPHGNAPGVVASNLYSSMLSRLVKFTFLR